MEKGLKTIIKNKIDKREYIEAKYIKNYKGDVGCGRVQHSHKWDLDSIHSISIHFYSFSLCFVLLSFLNNKY
jgi:hypothetical protein